MNTMQDKIADLQRRRAAAELGGGADRLDKQRQAGKLTARERIAALVDPTASTRPASSPPTAPRSSAWRASRCRPTAWSPVRPRSVVGSCIWPARTSPSPGRLGGRDSLREGRRHHAHGVEDRLALRVHQRLGRRPRAGRYRLAVGRRQGLPRRRAAVGRGAADLADLRTVRLAARPTARRSPTSSSRPARPSSSSPGRRSSARSPARRSPPTSWAGPDAHMLHSG